jgi:hypothetical protein
MGVGHRCKPENLMAPLSNRRVPRGIPAAPGSKGVNSIYTLTTGYSADEPDPIRAAAQAALRRAGVSQS